MNNYTIYHLHSDYSSATTNIDSVTKASAYIEKAKECGMSSLGFSEHGNIFEWYSKKTAIEKNGMKYIHGCEFYITEKLWFDEEITDEQTGTSFIKQKHKRDNRHCVLIARNYLGFLELNRLISLAGERENHFYYTPRLSMEELEKTSDNIIITSACLGSPLRSESEEFANRFLNFMVNNKERCFLEIQHHNVDDQKEFNEYLYQLSLETGLRLIAGTDTHSLNEELAEARVVLQKAKGIFFGNEEGWDMTFKTYDELVQSYEKQGVLPRSVYLEAINNTNVMSDMIEEFTIDTSSKCPKLYDNPQEKLREITFDCLKKHPYALEFHTYDELSKRMELELKLIDDCGYTDFILYQKYLRDWEHEHDIFCGPSRGSVSGSMLCYIIGITEVDSIKYGLNLFRFLNPNRVTVADVDSDYYEPDRDKVKDFILSDSIISSSEIVAFGTVALKGAIRDVGRAFEIPLSEVNKICNDVEGNEEKVRKKYPELFKYVDLIQGVIVSVSTHPSGVLVASENLAETMGLFSISSSKYMVSQLDMHSLNDLMYIKIDALGLDNIGIINQTCKLAGIKRITMDNIDMNDEKVWNDLANDTRGIFQMSSAFASQCMKKIFSRDVMDNIRKYVPDISYLKLMSFVNGLIRPGGEVYRDDVLNGKFFDNKLNDINELFGPTMGICLMQEQIMNFVVNFCGYSESESDNIRRCVHADTDILMGDGTTKKISDIKIGEYVISKNEYNSFIPKKVIGVYDNGYDKLYEIKTEHGYSLKCNTNHKFLTVNGYQELKDLNINDYIFVPKKVLFNSDNLRPNQRMTEKQMFAIGCLIGDGTISNGALLLTNSDINIINKYCECISSINLKNKCNMNVRCIQGKTVDNIYTCTISSLEYKKSWLKTISNLGLNKKSAYKRIPNCIQKYPIGGKLSSFIGGLFSTDGGYNIGNSYIDYSSISLELIKDLKNILLKYGIYSYISKSYVKDYDYYSYRLIISQRSSLLKFKNEILPFVVGYKNKIYSNLINNISEYSYDYLLPNECKCEVINSIKEKGLSLRQVNINLKSDKAKLNDVKAKDTINGIYCPMTYEILNSDYIPVRIKDIVELNEVGNVWDIEVEETHNYVANGIVVHNCVAKKGGTETQLPEIKERFISYTGSKYNLTDKQCEEIIEPILQQIESASRYSFSFNHSDAYSGIGYMCGWLRYYYPYEFIVSCLNVWYDKEGNSLEITEYARNKGIVIRNPKFRYSRGDYFIDKKNKVIYKGMSSIKYISKKLCDSLQLLHDNSYNNFMELLKDLYRICHINSNQLDILIKIDYFSEFGNSKTLTNIVKVYDYFKQGNGKQITIEEVDNIENENFKNIIIRNSIKKNKTYWYIDTSIILKEVVEYILLLNENYTIKEKIEFQQNMLGYVNLNSGDSQDRFKIVVLNIKDIKRKSDGKCCGYKLETMSLGTGKKAELTLWKYIYDKNPISQFDIIVIAPNGLQSKEWNGSKSWELIKYKIGGV